MIKPCLSVIALTLIYTSIQASSIHKGVGCWRTLPKRHESSVRMAGIRRAASSERTQFLGKKKGIVILAEFPDVHFKEGHDAAKYKEILNTPGYTTDEGFKGSVADYFHDQSNGLFELGFDVLGPYVAANNSEYYGQNDADGYDLHPEELIAEMCKAADDEVNFADYDWDGDGEVDEVFVVYAGMGEADSYIENTIWPHMWSLEETGTPLTLDNVSINIYACSNELDISNSITGIGTFCHEFSHCMGLPDLYDVFYDGYFGMSDFDLMSSGSYNGNSFCPAGYTAYEKMVCGWQEPIVLADEDVNISRMQPISEYGNTYILYNDAHPDEYYLIENRQKTQWDSHLPGKGLMITHVDYDAEVWSNNIPNSIISLSDAQSMGLTVGNDHQRITIFHADNDDDYDYWSHTGQFHTKTTLAKDLYPCDSNDSLTATSIPAASLYNKNSEGTKLMRGAILDITQNEDLTISFRYRAPQATVDAIRNVGDDRRSLPYYDLLGRKVRQPGRGIYIVHGKKVVL